MKKIKTQKNIIPILILIMFAFFIFIKIEKVYFPKNANNENKKILTPQEKKVISTTVIIGKETLYLSFIEGKSLYDILLEEKIKNNFTFSGKEYPNMGFFTTDIGTLHSKGNHYLMYYINNKEAEIGISSYIPKDGDFVEWKLK